MSQILAFAHFATFWHSQKLANMHLGELSNMEAIRWVVVEIMARNYIDRWTNLLDDYISITSFSSPSFPLSRVARYLYSNNGSRQMESDWSDGVKDDDENGDVGFVDISSILECSMFS